MLQFFFTEKTPRSPCISGECQTGLKCMDGECRKYLFTKIFSHNIRLFLATEYEKKMIDNSSTFICSL